MPPTSRTILIVDDDPDTLNIISMIIERLGHTPIPCPSSEVALQKTLSVNFDIALVDVMLPVMNGYELLKALKARTPEKHVPVILITAKDDDSDVYLGYQYGADYYMTKPFTPKQLENGLRLFL